MSNFSSASSNEHIINIEVKAKSFKQDKIRKILKSLKADFRGTDLQTDTYFNVPNGKLKLREGKIENHLIHYDRENKSEPKQSNVILYKSNVQSSLKEILQKALGVLVVVSKQREIYFINNVKFHIDDVKDLGTFIEIEVIDKDGNIGRTKLLEQCNFYINLFEICNADLVSLSYSDMLMSK